MSGSYTVAAWYDARLACHSVVLGHQGQVGQHLVPGYHELT